MNREKVAFYCKCGAAWTGTVPLRAAEMLRTQWSKVHYGPDHVPVTARQAAEARRRAERTATK